MQEPRPAEDALEPLREALAHNGAIEALLAEKMRSLEGAGRVQTSVANAFVKRGLGVTFEEFVQRSSAASVLMRNVLEGRIDLRHARPDLIGYEQLVERMIRWIDGLMPNALKHVKDEQQAEVRRGLEALKEVRLLAAALRRI